MQRAYSTLALVFLCSGCFESSPSGFTKEAARERGGRAPDGSDICRTEGWYDDDVCDDFCPEPDPDCATSCPDPDPTDPRVRYVSMDPEVCAVIDYACEPGETGFDNMCGCGCIAPAEMCADPTMVRYLSRDPDECAVLDYVCPAGEVQFSDPCGCGCRPSTTCPDPTDPNVRYVSRDPMICASADLACPTGTTPFDNDCGCGCIGEEVMCPDPTDPRVRYVSMDPSSCARTDWGCPAEDTRFDNACGCGCISPETTCPDPTDPLVRYISMDPMICAASDWACPPEATAFDNACGCGCISPSTTCTGLDEVSCSIDPVCAPTYGGVCDCTCDRAGSGYESGGCPTCPSRCFFFDGCIDTPSVELGCPNPHRIGTRYIGRSAADCAGHSRTECGDEEAFFDNSCGCGCVGSSTTP